MSDDSEFNREETPPQAPASPCKSLLDENSEVDESPQVLEVVVGEEDGDRIDKVMLRFLPDFSRTYVQRLIKNGGVKVAGKLVKASHQLRGGDRIVVELDAAARDEEPQPQPQDIPIDVIYEDEAIIVVNKQADLAIHPGPGRSRGTLVNGLVYHFNRLSRVAGESRPGVVHRLDKDTTGVLVVAKTDRDHSRISKQFELREVQKEYVAIVYGVVPFDSDYVNHPIARHRHHRERMAVDPVHGKPSSTFYAVVERFRRFSIVRAHPRSGRTHQIRVHLTSIGHPIVSDATYARRKSLRLSEINPDHAGEDQVLMVRQALHAHRLSFTHPRTEEKVSFMAEIPADMLSAMEALREYRR